MPLIKPGRWSVNLAEIAPQYRHLWDGLQAMVPFWDGSGTPQELVARKQLVSNNNAVWQTDTLGPSLEFEAGTLAQVDLDASRIDFSTPLFAGGFSVWVIFRSESDEATNRTVFSSAKDSGGTNWAFHMTHRSTGLLQAHLDTATSLTVAIDNDRTLYNVLYTWNLDDVRLYLDGKERASGNGISQTVFQADLVTTIGDFNGAVGGFVEWDGAILGVAVWNRSLSALEAQQLYFDPFGFIRPAPIVTEVSAVSGSGAIAEQSDDATGAGTVLVSGSGAIAEVADDASGVGTILVSGAGAISEQADDATGAGNVLVSGAGAITEQPDNATGAGTSGVLGSGAITEQPDNATGVGTSGAVAALIAAVSVVGRPRVSVISRRRIKVTDRDRVT